MDEGLLGLGEDLVVAAHAAMPTQPGEGALDHPAPREHLEARARGWLATRWDPGPGRTSLRNLDRESQVLLGEALEGSSVRLIHPEMRQPRIAGRDPSEEALAAVAIVDVRGMDPDRQD